MTQIINPGNKRGTPLILPRRVVYTPQVYGIYSIGMGGIEGMYLGGYPSSVIL